VGYNKKISDFHNQEKSGIIIGILTILDAYQRSIEAAKYQIYQRSIEAAKYQRAIVGCNNKM